MAVGFGLLVLLYLAPAGTAAGAMKLLAPETGWVTSLGHLYWTTDGGDHWTNITPNPPEVPHPALGGVLFRSISEGWALIFYAEPVPRSNSAAQAIEADRTQKTLYGIAHTLDSGASWSFTPVIYPELPQWMQDGLAGPGSFYFLDALHGWIDFSFMGNARPGKLLATEDGGRTWKWVNSPGVSGPITFLSPQDGWLVSNLSGEQLYVTHDGCKTWQGVSLSPPAQVGAATYTTFQAPPVFQDEHRGVLVVHYSGHPRTPTKLVVYSTIDRGITWQPIKVLQEARESVKSAGFPFAIADSTIIVSTGSSAKNVTVEPVPLDGSSSEARPSDLGTAGLTFADKNNGWALSAGSGLIATRDGGATWKHIDPSPLPPFPQKRVPALKGPPIKVTHSELFSSSPETAASQGSSSTHISRHLGFEKRDVIRYNDMGICGNTVPTTIRMFTFLARRTVPMTLQQPTPSKAPSGLQTWKRRAGGDSYMVRSAACLRQSARDPQTVY